jgi:hypothetical protein
MASVKLIKIRTFERFIELNFLTISVITVNIFGG